MKSILLSAIASTLFVSCASDQRVSIDQVDPQVIQGITFAEETGKIFLPLGEVEVFMSNQLEWKKRRTLTDGTLLITLMDMEKTGSKVLRNASGQSAEVSQGKHHFKVVVGAKRAEVDLAKQRLRAWQGDRLVLSSRVSSGRSGRTPSGKFFAGPYKARRHYSSLYNNAPMPYSVQVSGNVFIHGFTSVPDYPASHGCIRVPLDEGNPAKFFYEWVSVGTPIQVR
ncbi:L,D-transpeptidase [bacterium]|nr:L,D-transpeptidase [bacterium]